MRCTPGSCALIRSTVGANSAPTNSSRTSLSLSTWTSSSPVIRQLGMVVTAPIDTAAIKFSRQPG
ncbi:Uncharacterised protein [Mycobacterium tuberculosis]|nr:Uncharacterised protein [Mycobacterium tuberculosis]